jgi:dimeric dUTPase (all-alpha-NTP-PPase superfamily)
MEFEKLFKMQTALDRYIEENHQLQNEDLFDRKILALLVEIGELANETRSFKFWSVKPSSEKAVILEEFVDGIHFILSLGIESSFDKEPVELEEKQSELTVNDLFLEIYEAVSTFRKSRSLSHYLTVLEYYLQLGAKLGISFQEIEKAYVQKNEVNYKRQQNRY